MSRWKGQSESTSLLCFSNDSLIYEVEALPDSRFRFTVGNLWNFRSSPPFERLDLCLMAMNRLVECQTDKGQARIMNEIDAAFENARREEIA